MNAENLAAIDIGTNSCRLLIACPKGEILYRESIATKLGEGLNQNKALSEEAFQRGLEAFLTYAERLKKYNVGQYRAIATAACRMAENGKEFVDEVFKKTGIRLEIVDGQTEAKLNFRGALLNAPKSAKYVLVFDIGGGSTEISLAENEKEFQFIHTVSVPWGARNASEAFETTKSGGQAKLQSEIRAYVKAFCAKAQLEKYKKNCALLATSSTPLRLTAFALKHPCYDKTLCDGQSVACDVFDTVISKIISFTPEEKENSIYIGPNRAPIINAACIIFQTIYQELGFKEITASLKGAQEAIIADLIKQFGGQ